jgi:sigma-B regulation protein RsbU (phosphoserine phosphatase)
MKIAQPNSSERRRVATMTVLQTVIGACDEQQDFVTGFRPMGPVQKIVERMEDEASFHICIDALTREDRNSLERQLTLATRIQKNLVPASDFSSAGWQICHHYAPAGLLSGDYCDFFESNSSLYFLLGDVTGKGVAASMMMSQLYATFRSLATTDLPIDLMVETANRIFSQSTLAGQFATVVAGRAEQNGSVEFVSAGHLPLLHLHNSSVELEPATGIPLGMFAGAQFEISRLSLGSGDSLLLYTDGLTEARNPAGQEYGVRRLRKTVAPHTAAGPSQLISECLLDQLDFTRGAQLADDLSLMVIRRAA